MKLIRPLLIVAAVLLGLALLAIGNPGGLLRVPPSELTFSHTLHVADVEVECLTCHESISASTTAGDRNLPDMDVCSDCHDIDDEEECGTCHRDPEDPMPAPDLDWPILFNHESHLAQDVPCDLCHAGVADSEVLTEANMPSMSTCFTCHDGVKVRDECALCHGADLTLTDIHPSGWRHVHAERAVLDRAWCANCHADESFCLDCHRGDNTDGQIHELNYALTHGLDAKGKDADCARCHDRRSFCNDCHEQNNRIPWRHSTLSWMADHGEEARRDVENCASCHDVFDPTCARSGCHSDPDGIRGTDPPIHAGDGGQLGSHGPWHDDDAFFCYQCHTTTRTRGVGFCGYCHN